jgi:hypothetical protein
MRPNLFLKHALNGATTMSRSGLLLCVLLSASSSLFADQLILNNGDRLTGTVVKSDGKVLVFKTDYAGELTVQWDAVQGITSTEPLHVGLKNGQSVVGPVANADGKLEVATSDSGKIEASKADILTIRNDSEQKAYEKSQHPGLLEGWEGGANISFALTRGNSETKNLALAFTGTRTSLSDKLALYANTLYASNDAPGPFRVQRPTLFRREFAMIATLRHVYSAT